ncbi:uroporphyrinogen-III synthase [Cerasibacillus terrae]|uniref:Uroporphyrinogen-III synthase n=1 Tax=Cerasibacillus terrae TaxID=2498845 RepID=A0A5C8NLH4_9BACI|nr:uroporphyrinogen-III synthase [Cerasibacillus terrae]TXL62569.1 uroporphyrinogen-III synthase [Cerasibacillus terrae]
MGPSLENKTILVTREKKQAKEFSRKIKKIGGKPVEIPLLKITCKDHPENKQIFEELAGYEWLFFTSINGVHSFFELLQKYGMSVNSIKGKKIATVGHKTENCLKEYGYHADFIPTIYNAETMAAEFSEQHSVDGKFLLVRGNRSMNVLPEAFSKLRVDYSSMEVYETSLHLEIQQQLQKTLQSNSFDYLTFTSPSTIDAFVQMNGLKYIEIETTICVCIGTTTEKAAITAGFKKILVPEQFTIDGMIQVMLDHLGKVG